MQNVSLFTGEYLAYGKSWFNTSFDRINKQRFFQVYITGICFVHGPTLLIKQGTSLEIRHPSLRWLNQAYISIILYWPLYSWSNWLYGIFFSLTRNTFWAADMGFNCFKLLINCRLLLLSIFKTPVEIHPFPVLLSTDRMFL